MWRCVEVCGSRVCVCVGSSGGGGGVGSLRKASTQPTWHDVTGLAKPR